MEIFGWLYRIFLANILVSIAMLFIGCSKTENTLETVVTRNPVNIRTMELIARDFVPEKSFYSKLAYKKNLIVKAEQAGKVDALEIRVGQSVEQGDILLRFPPQNYELQTDQLRLAFNDIRDQYLRELNVYHSGGSAKARVDELKTLMNIKERALRHSEELYSIKASFDGIIADVSITPGQAVSAGDTLLTIADPAEYIAEFFVSIDDIDNISEGAVVHIDLDTESLEGSVVQKALVMDPERRAYRVKAELPVSARRSLAGSSQELIVEMDPLEGALLIPLECATISGSRYFVMVNKDGVAEKREIEVRDIIGLELLVGEGLQTGDQLIIDGMHKLTDKSSVREMD